jgi:hypothetical protein
MTDTTTFSTRSNAKRAAEKAIRVGSAPSIDYGIKERGLNGYEIVWKTGLTPEAADDGYVELGSQELAEIEAENDPITTGEELREQFDSWEQDMPDLFPPGARVIVQVGPRKRRTGAVDYRVDATSCRVKLDGPMPSILCRYSQLTRDDGSEPIPMPAKAERRKTVRLQGERKPSKNAELDAAAARGEMPAKPIITSKANQLQYQKRFDQLEKSALDGDWDAVRGYEVKGINSYAKMVKQYRDRLLAAHEAQQASKTEAA